MVYFNGFFLRNMKDQGYQIRRKHLKPAKYLTYFMSICGLILTFCNFCETMELSIHF